MEIKSLTHSLAMRACIFGLGQLMEALAMNASATHRRKVVQDKHTERTSWRDHERLATMCNYMNAENLLKVKRV